MTEVDRGAASDHSRAAPFCLSVATHGCHSKPTVLWGVKSNPAMRTTADSRVQGPTCTTNHALSTHSGRSTGGAQAPRESRGMRWSAKGRQSSRPKNPNPDTYSSNQYGSSNDADTGAFATGRAAGQHTDLIRRGCIFQRCGLRRGPRSQGQQQSHRQQQSRLHFREPDGGSGRLRKSGNFGNTGLRRPAIG